MADDSGIDPRHPAQFQRGFDPAVHPAAAPTVPAGTAGPVRLAGGPVPSAERVAPPPRFEAPPVEPAPEVEPHPAPEADEDERVREQRRALVVEYALPVVAGVLLLAAGMFFWDAVTDRSLFYGYDDPSQYAYAQVRNTLPGPFVVGSIIALTAWFMLRAVRRPQVSG